MTERGSILIEMNTIGKAVEVIAINSETLREVRFTAPASASEAEIKALAASKLAYVANRDREKSLSSEQTKIPPRNPRGGIIV